MNNLDGDRVVGIESQYHAKRICAPERNGFNDHEG